MDNTKLHYKMYKSGKKWLIAGIVTTGFGLVAINTVANADTNQIENVKSTDVNNGSAKSDAKNNDVESDVKNSNVKSNTKNGGASLKSAKSNTSEQTAASLNKSEQATTKSVALENASSNDAKQADASSEDTRLNSAKQADTKTSSANSNDAKVVSVKFEADNSTSLKANAKSKLDKRKTVKKSKSTVTMTATTKDVQDNVKVNQNLSDKTFTNNPTNISSNIKKINGKYQYLNSQGKAQKNIILTDDKNAAYFDANGNYVNLSKQLPKNNLKTIKNKYLEKNALYALDTKNIKNINGFLTADTWYRPKQILKDGKKWTKSTSKDFRPLLMTWWPNKQTQVNYLNYMHKNGLGQRNYTTNSSLNTLLKGTQKVQAKIEKKISQNDGKTDWLKTTIHDFVKKQPQWNIDSEAKWGYDGFQGGNLRYGNNKLTPEANSNYRLLNRGAGSEFLLESDVDNSNPVVQAENLNWLHYMLNTGSIISKDKDANFDGVRLDAVGDMDTDFLRLTNQYLRDAYKTTQNDSNANKHLSIIESGPNDTYTGQNELVIDNGTIGAMTGAFGKEPGDRPGPDNIITKGMANQANNDGTQTVTPNYTFIHSHDTGVQEKLVQIIVDKIDKNGGFQSSPETFRKALQYYYQDMDSTNKTYTYYNMPTLYSLLLTNKDTVPRVYYGDMYQDDGQYMQNKTINYNDISSLLQARPKYVAGGQSMKTSDYGQILTSVRYGKGANNATDSGDNLTRNSGIAVIASNNNKLNATNVSVNMGTAHKNQAYRPLILSTDNGTQTFNSDDDAKNNVIYTDDNGNLNLNNQVKGYSNPQVSGYLSVWVPVGASDNQDVRTQANTDNHNDDKALHQNDALDSNVIYESFSNMQQNPTSSDNTLLNKLTQNAGQLKQWGITSVEFPPLYKPAKGNDFLDEGIQNGYAFSDRYDLGLSGSTKYGTYDQLATALKSIHAQGIQGMTDIVGNQLYDLNKPDVVSATRANSNGDATNTSTISNDLYYALAKSTGKDYQAKYGGEFLAQLKKQYPDLFTTKQKSTGKTIDASVKLKQWSAKYLNGSNLQGSGAQYILRNAGNNQYFTVGKKGYNLPNQLLGKATQTGWIKNKKTGQISYYTYSGQQAKGANMNIDNKNYTFDNQGHLVIGKYNVDNRDYLSISNGEQVTNTFVWHNGKLSFYDKNGVKATNGFTEDPNNQGTFYYFNKKGNALTGSQVIDGANLFFNKDGIQVKGQIAVDKNGYSHYYNENDGKQVANQDVTFNGKTYHADANGNLNIPVQKTSK